MLNKTNNLIEEQLLIIPGKERKQALQILVNYLGEISDDYNKIMKMFYYFDDKSLGTISEKVIVFLLKHKGIDIIHTGGENSLADIKIQGQGISLKTTDISKEIGLGSSVKIQGGDAKVVTEYLNGTKQKISDIQDPKIKQIILNRLDAITEKISDDILLWAGKKAGKTSKILDKFTFYLFDFNKQFLYEFIEDNYYVSPTKESYTIIAEDGVIFASADAKQKYLNLNPLWLFKKATQIDIKYSDVYVVKPKAEQNKTYEQMSDEVFDNMLKVLIKEIDSILSE